MITTQWPLLSFLQTANSLQTARPDFVEPCDALFHPSLVWRDYRLLLERGLSLWGSAIDAAMKIVTSVAWKAGSEAVYEPTGLTVSHYTQQCPLGVVATNILRALGFVLSSPNAGDTMNIVEMYLNDTNRVFASTAAIEMLVHSSWPVLQVLTVLHGVARDRMRRATLAVNPSHTYVLPAVSRPPGNCVIVLLVTEEHLDTLELTLANNERYMQSISYTHVVTDSPRVHVKCMELSQMRHAGSEQPTVRCEPVVAQNALITKYFYLLRLLESNDFVFFHTPDFVPLDRSFLEAAQRLLASETRFDLALLPDLYSRLYSERVMLFSRTHQSYTFLDTLLDYSLRAPYPDERAALHFMLDADAQLGLVPGVSFLSGSTPEVRKTSLSSIFATFEGFVPKTTPVVFGIDMGCSGESRSVCLEERMVLYTSNKTDERVQRILASRRHGDFAKSARRFQRSADPLSRDADNFHRQEVIGNKRRICEEPTSAAVDSEDVMNAFIYHVNFAHNCCERDQSLSSSSALEFFANESRPLNGSLLDETFLHKNAEIMHFDRTHLVTGKTPSSLVGYYVWKPYAILKGICDLPYGSIVVYTDAGVMTAGPLRPLLQKYLAVSDVTAVQTEMFEQARSKRDAFLILDADFVSVAATQQVASGIIAFRKTPNTVDFFEWWLAALESKFVITEEPSRLGSEYPGFVNSNDDQTGLSLLFKKFGYMPFSYIERNQVINIARNLAKFLNAADAMALGQSPQSASYLKAADDRA